MRVLIAIGAAIVIAIGIIIVAGYAGIHPGPATVAVPAANGQVTSLNQTSTTVQSTTPNTTTAAQPNVGANLVNTPLNATANTTANTAANTTANTAARSSTVMGATGPLGVIRQGPNGQVLYTVDQASVNREAQADVVGQSVGDTPMGNATVKSINVTLDNGKIFASGQAAVGGLSVPYSITGTAAPVNGKAVVTITEAKAAGFNMPQSSVDGIQQMLQSQLDMMLAQEHLQVRSINIANGQLQATGVAQ